jgi:CheY-like chemotaxis protein
MADPKTCFLIDDDLDDQLIFSLALAQVDNGAIACITADNGHDALKKLEGGNFIPDFIFLDLNMPGMNGIECFLKIRDQQHLRNVPVVIYTTSCNQKDITESGALGATAYITKPYHVVDLSKKLTDFFTLKHR